MKLILLNYRNGWSCNSSSSHTTILTSRPEKFSDDTFEDYDWNEFILKSSFEKMNYFKSQINANLYGVSKKIKDEIYKELNLKKNKIEEVDHQSVWNLPVNPDKHTLHLGFLKKLKEYLLQDNIVILGGDDSGVHNISLNFLVDHPSYIVNKISFCYDSLICYQDGEVFTFIDTGKGEKFKLTFDEELENKYNKSFTPDLIDFNIMDTCNENCPFCYRGCTKDGKQASLDTIKKYIKYFALQLKCCEIVLGGGNLFMYYDINGLKNLIKDFNKNGVNNTRDKYNPHVWFNTTVQINSLKRAELLMGKDKLFDFLSSFCRVAVSCFTLDDFKYVERLQKYCLSNNNTTWMRVNFICQLIPDIISDDTLLKIAEENKSGMTVSLLGYKTTGRGNSVNHLKKSDEVINKFLDIISSKENYGNDLSVDTCFVNEYRDVLEKRDCLKFSYYTEEGKFSCFVDGVKNKMASSSYDINQDDILPDMSNMLDIFHKY